VALGEAVRSFNLLIKSLLPLTRAVDAFNRAIGQYMSWLILVAVLVSATNATVRKLFDTSSNSWLELQWVLYSAVFLLCAPWTLLDNEHIRVDIINNLMPTWLRNTIDLVGHALFLLPLTIVMIVTGIPFFEKSYMINEQSMNAGGLPQWPAKSLIAIGFTILLFQAISEFVKRLAIMRGLMDDPHAAKTSALEAEVEHLVDVIEKR
jgi:TRAP-type mannitol/chloroaromatic compound transport system permease small subunit